MSRCYDLACPAMNLYIWVGQGWKGMENFYSGSPEQMEKLGRFLEVTRGRALVLLETQELGPDMQEFEEEDDDG